MQVDQLNLGNGPMRSLRHKNHHQHENTIFDILHKLLIGNDNFKSFASCIFADCKPNFHSTLNWAENIEQSVA